MPAPNKDTDIDFMSKLFLVSGGLEEIKIPKAFLSMFRPEFIRNPDWRWWKPWVKKIIENPIPALCEWSNETKIDIVRGSK